MNSFMKRARLGIFALVASTIASSCFSVSEKQVDHFRSDNTIEEFLDENSKLGQAGYLDSLGWPYQLNGAGAVSNYRPNVGQEIHDILASAKFYDDDGSGFEESNRVTFWRVLPADSNSEWNLTFSDDFKRMRLYYTAQVPTSIPWWWWERYYAVDGYTADIIKQGVWQAHLREVEAFYDEEFSERSSLGYFVEMLESVNSNKAVCYTDYPNPAKQSLKMIHHIDDALIEKLKSVSVEPLDIPFRQLSFLYSDFEVESPDHFFVQRQDEMYAIYFSKNHRYIISTASAGPTYTVTDSGKTKNPQIVYSQIYPVGEEFANEAYDMFCEFVKPYAAN